MLSASAADGASPPIATSTNGGDATSPVTSGTGTGTPPFGTSVLPQPLLPTPNELQLKQFTHQMAELMSSWSRSQQVATAAAMSSGYGSPHQPIHPPTAATGLDPRQLGFSFRAAAMAAAFRPGGPAAVLGSGHGNQRAAQQQMNVSGCNHISHLFLISL